jgi:signal transduction histidine kinase
MQNNRDLTDTSKQQTESNLEFVHVLSHAFKTPLTVIKLYADLMMDDLGQLDSATQYKYLSAIKASVDDMNFLLANTLNFQKISCAKMEWHDDEVDIIRLITRATYPFEVACQTKEIPFSINFALESLTAVIDAECLVQIVYNLLANSLKLADKGGINVGLSVNDTAADQNIHLTIGHSGRGIPEEQLQIMRDSNKRSDEPEEMGLYVAKHIVAHYQGRLWAENTPGKGSAFHVELPLRQSGRSE